MTKKGRHRGAAGSGRGGLAAHPPGKGRRNETEGTEMPPEKGF